MTESARDCWATPWPVVDALSRRFAGGYFDLDPCCSQSTCKAHRGYTLADDGLSKPWYGRVFVNPPYSDVGSWVDKACREIDAGNAYVVVLLLLNSTDTAWYAQLERQTACGGGVLLFPQGRINFIPPNADIAASSNSRGSLIAVLWPRLPNLRLLREEPNDSDSRIPTETE